jgi:hypothetical protein
MAVSLLLILCIAQEVKNKDWGHMTIEIPPTVAWLLVAHLAWEKRDKNK